MARLAPRANGRRVKAQRVVLIGPEASGKTSLAAALAAHFGAPLTLEAARLFAEARAEPLAATTVEPIARLSMRLEDEALAAVPPPSLLVRDTDLLSTVVYARHYYGSAAPWIEAEARARLGDLYLLCAPDLPWSADGVRDRPTQRDELFAVFRAALTEFGAPFVEIRGGRDARLRAALSAVEVLRRAG